MQIGLIDVDSHNFPNLCLMKLSAYHKAKGDNVEWWNGLKHYDIVYQSRVFNDTYTKDLEWVVNADEIIRGGAMDTIYIPPFPMISNIFTLITHYTERTRLTDSLQEDVQGIAPSVSWVIRKG